MVSKYAAAVRVFILMACVSTAESQCAAKCDTAPNDYIANNLKVATNQNDVNGVPYQV
jgi:hypothetical protein